MKSFKLLYLSIILYSFTLSSQVNDSVIEVEESTQNQTELELEVEQVKILKDQIRYLQKTGAKSEEIKALRLKIIKLLTPGIQELEVGKKKSLSETAEDLLLPLMQSLSHMTTRPRRIQALQTEIEELERQALNLKELKEKLDQTKLKDIFLKPELELIKKMSLETQSKINEKRIYLNKFQESSEGLFDFLNSKATLQIKKKLLHLGTALIVFFMILWILGLWKPSLEKVIRKRKTEAWLRPIIVLYSLISFIVASSISLFVLYLFNDWTMLTLFLLFFIAVAWSFKQHLPKYIGSIRLLFNLGTIREGELVSYQGLTYLVEHIGAFVILKNNRFKGAVLRLNHEEAMSLHSYPKHSEDELFPVHKGDWVKSDEDVFQIDYIGPKYLVVKTLVGDKRVLKTTEFDSSALTHLSQGFGLEMIFNFDYENQKDIFNIRDKFEFFLKQNFKTPYQNFNLEFYQASAHSLDMRLCVAFQGAFAGQYKKLQRELNRLYVEFCNHESLSIPFEQLKVHYDK